ncbi:MAG: ABC transporter permease subunit [Oscillospiraceae bacterium]|nr:ABC transporter permease subunit [Oscillospiraceae bacterium]
MGAIYRREIKSFFSSSIAYVFLTSFFLFSGYFFFAGTLLQATTDMSGMFGALFLIVVILIPVLTMKLLSEEKKQKTDQGLLTAPVSLWGIVLGKYFAALTLYTIGLCVTLVYAFILSYFGTVLWGMVISNFLSMFLLGSAFIAVGVFISSLTENQITSAVTSFLVLIVLYLIDQIAALINIDFIKNALMSLSFYTRYIEFTRGIFNLSSIVFYISVAFVFNFLTVRVFEKKRWS